MIYIEEVERSSPDSKITTFDRPTWKCLRKLPDFQPEVILRDCYDFQESVYELPKKFHPSEYPWLRKEYSRNVDEDETEAVFGEETDGVDEEEEDINNSSPEMEDTDLVVIALTSDDPALEKESSEASELTEWAEKMLPLPPGMTPGEPESGSDPLAVLSGEDDPGQDILISESEKKENPKHCFKFKEEDPEEDNESLPPKLKNTARKSAPLKVGSKALTSLPARKRPLNSTAIKLNEQIKQEDLKLVKKEKLDAIQDSDGTEVVEILSSDEEEIENISAGRSITSQAGKPLGSAGSSNNVSEDSEYEPSRPATKKLKRESNQAGTGARHEEIIDLT